MIICLQAVKAFLHFFKKNQKLHFLEILEEMLRRCYMHSDKYHSVKHLGTLYIVIHTERLERYIIESLYTNFFVSLLIFTVCSVNIFVRGAHTLMPGRIIFIYVWVWCVCVCVCLLAASEFLENIGINVSSVLYA